MRRTVSAKSAPQKHRAYEAAMLDESTWVEVIQKMDEVYSKLLADEVALEEKNAQLEQSQQFIFGLLYAMSDVLVACNENGIVEETNRALCELLGKSESELHDVALESLMADQDSVTKLRLACASDDMGNAGGVIEIQMHNAAGHTVSVDMNCTPRYDSHGRHIGHVLVGRPMGELKRAYHQLREAHEALKQTQKQLLHSEKMASLGRLVAGVAHELNNPISFVLGNVFSMQRYAQRVQQYLDAIHSTDRPEEIKNLRKNLRIDALLKDLPSLMEGTLEGAKRTADIVAGLNSFSAMGREEYSHLDINEVVDRAIHWVLKGKAPNFNVIWKPTDTCEVTGHAGQLLQVMMNLIQNAYDAVTGASVAEPTLRISIQRNDKTVVVSFSDNGPGVSQEHMQRIFEPFFTTKVVGQGTGLGLSISYGIVQQHHGDLRLSNLAEGGACFELVLPLADK